MMRFEQKGFWFFPSPAYLIRTKKPQILKIYIIIQYFRKVWKEIIAFLVFFKCYLSIYKFSCPDNPGCTVFWTLPVTIKLYQWRLLRWIYHPAVECHAMCSRGIDIHILDLLCLPIFFLYLVCIAVSKIIWC
jgi:hypothetical protein